MQTFWTLSKILWVVTAVKWQLYQLYTAQLSCVKYLQVHMFSSTLFRDCCCLHHPVVWDEAGLDTDFDSCCLLLSLILFHCYILHPSPSLLPLPSILPDHTSPISTLVFQSIKSPHLHSEGIYSTRFIHVHPTLPNFPQLFPPINPSTLPLSSLVTCRWLTRVNTLLTGDKMFCLCWQPVPTTARRVRGQPTRLSVTMDSVRVATNRTLMTGSHVLVSESKHGTSTLSLEGAVV